jgi:hypothetical protein
VTAIGFGIVVLALLCMPFISPIDPPFSAALAIILSLTVGGLLLLGGGLIWLWDAMP